MADLLTGIDIEDLRRPVAAGGDIATIMAEAHAADDTLVRKVVEKVHIKLAVYARVEHRMPILALALQMRWELLRVKLGELVADLLKLRLSVLEVRRELLVLWRRWRRTGTTRRSWVWVRLALLRSRWTTKTRRAYTWLRTGRGGWLGSARAITCELSVLSWDRRNNADSTIYAGWASLRLTVCERVVRWTRWCVEAWRCLTLHMPWQAWLSWLLLGRRRESRSALSGVRHDPLEQIRWAMADGRRSRMLRASRAALRRSSALFELGAQPVDLFLISTDR